MTFVKVGARLAALMSVGLIIGCGEAKPDRKRVDRRDNRPAEGGTQVAAAPTKEAPKSTSTASAPASAPASGSGWGTIKGRVVWGKDLPEKKVLNTGDKDKDWCVDKNPQKGVPDETLVVDPQTKGIRYVFAYLRKPSAIHPDYPKTKAEVKAADEKQYEELNKIKFSELKSAVAAKKVQVKDLKAPVVLDQVHCQYVPHAIAVRDGQSVLALNYEPVSHNINVVSAGGSNSSNLNMPPGNIILYDWKPEANPLSVECSIHGWMKMYAMVFDHPYFAVTGPDGSFEIKNAPAGEVTLLVRNPKYIDPKKGGKGDAKGAVITVKPGETVDLGEIKYSGE